MHRLIDIYNGWLPSQMIRGLTIFRLVSVAQDEPFAQMGTLKTDLSAKPAFNRLRNLHSGQTVNDC